ncbi:MAG: hypothetical protein ACRDST_18230 [Pseudonocardiaceae bacterium]
MRDLSSVEVSDSELSSVFTAPRGGVMTDEVGVTTGELELRTRSAPNGQINVEVRYAEAEEWYRISAADVVLRDPADHRPVHEALLGVLHRPEG